MFGAPNYEPTTETNVVFGGYANLLNQAISAMEANNNLVFAVIATPSEINGRDPKGQYADLVLNLGDTGVEDFELDVLNLNYEPTRLDHSS